VSDDKPFFFQFLDLRRWSTTGGETIYAKGLRTYTTDSLAIAVVALLMVLAPLRNRGGAQDRDPSAFDARRASWAAALGALYLGHPTWAVAATLLSLLLSSSLGAWWVGRSKTPAKSARAGAAVAAALALLAALTLPMVLRALSLDALAARVLVFVLCVAPLGAAMGVPFAGGLRATKGAPRVAWTIAVNALAGVVAALAVPVGAMAFGFRAVAVCAAALYAVALLTSPTDE
jgi:hypothetical protein